MHYSTRYYIFLKYCADICICMFLLACTHQHASCTYMLLCMSVHVCADVCAYVRSYIIKRISYGDVCLNFPPYYLLRVGENYFKLCNHCLIKLICTCRHGF